MKSKKTKRNNPYHISKAKAKIKQKGYPGYVVVYWIGSLPPKFTAPIGKYSALRQVVDDKLEPIEVCAERVLRNYREMGYQAVLCNSAQHASHVIESPAIRAVTVE